MTLAPPPAPGATPGIPPVPPTTPAPAPGTIPAPPEKRHHIFIRTLSRRHDLIQVLLSSSLLDDIWHLPYLGGLTPPGYPARTQVQLIILANLTIQKQCLCVGVCVCACEL